MTAACGLDFGTSNTTLGLAIGKNDDAIAMASLEDGETTLPSAIFFDFEERRRLFGRAAIAGYVGGIEGRFMRSLKSVLGTSLIDDQTELGGGRIGFKQVIAIYIAEIRRRGELVAGRPIERVVHGRPVHFVDGDDDADRCAEAALADVAREAGFKEVSFQLEPIAAALDYEASVVTGEELALIADIGGGTSDFTVIRLSPARKRQAERREDVLATDGVRVGGTDFDRNLSLSTVMPALGHRSPMRRPGLSTPAQLFTDLATWSRINLLYTAKTISRIRELIRESAAPHLLVRLLKVLELRRGHTLAMETERAKIALTATERTEIDLDWIEPNLTVAADLAAFDAATATLSESIAGSIRRCLRQAALPAAAIDSVFLTGGSTLLPTVRRAILGSLPEARVVDGDRFGSVGQGLALEALRRYA